MCEHTEKSVKPGVVQEGTACECSGMTGRD